MTDPQKTPEDGIGIDENAAHPGTHVCHICWRGNSLQKLFRGSERQDRAINGESNSTAWRISVQPWVIPGQAAGNEKWLRTSLARRSARDLQKVGGQHPEKEIDPIRQLLRIGIQRKTQVTFSNSKHTVTQAYCSALPVAYCEHSIDLWEGFAKLVLEAGYEATICTAILNSPKQSETAGCFLHHLAGEAFGNRTEWITDSLKRALILYKDRNSDAAQS